MMALSFIAGLIVGAPVAFLAYAIALDSARRGAAQDAAFAEWMSGRLSYGGTDTDTDSLRRTP